MEPLNFPNLKASTLGLTFVHILKGFWQILLKIRPGALYGSIQAYLGKVVFWKRLNDTVPWKHLGGTTLSGVRV